MSTQLSVRDKNRDSCGSEAKVKAAGLCDDGLRMCGSGFSITITRSLHRDPVGPVSCLACGVLSLMMPAMREFDGLRVRVDDVVHMPGLDAPPDRPYPFVYFITIHNDSPVPVTIRARKWVVKEQGGQVIVVEGDGVVGQQPVIEPGGHFSYNSYHVVAADAVAAGAFFGEIGSGDWVYVRIPEFELRVPRAE